jgi:hypothetical protein
MGARGFATFPDEVQRGVHATALSSASLRRRPARQLDPGMSERPASIEVRDAIRPWQTWVL